MVIKVKKIIFRLALNLISAVASTALILLGIISLAVLWVISHPNAPQTLYNWASTSPLTADYWPEGLAIGKLEGPIYQGLSLQDIHYPIHTEDELSGQLDIAKLELKWLPHRLFANELAIKSLKMSRPHLKLITASEPQPTDTPLDWTSLQNLAFDTADLHQLFTPLATLDWDINLQQLSVKDFVFAQDSQTWEIKQIHLGFKWHQQLLTLNQFEVDAFHSRLELTGRLEYHHAQHTRIEWQAAIHNWENFSILPGSLAEQLQRPDLILPAIEQHGRLDINEQTLTVDLAVTGPVELTWQQHLFGNEQELDWETQIQISRPADAYFDSLNLPLDLESIELSSRGQGGWFVQALEAHQQLQIKSGQLPDVTLQNRIAFQPNVYHETEMNAQLAINLADHGTLHHVLLMNLDNKTGQFLVNTQNFALPGTQRDDQQAWLLSLDTGIQLLDWETRSVILSIPQLRLDGLPAPLEFSGHALSQLKTPETYQLDWLASDIRYGDITGQFDLILKLAKDRSEFLLDRLGLSLGDNQLSLAAQLNERVHAELTLNAPNLNQLHPDLSGVLIGAVNLQQDLPSTSWLTSLANAQLTQNWQAQQLNWQDWYLDKALLITNGKLDDLLSHDIKLQLVTLTSADASQPLLQQLDFHRQPGQLQNHNQLELTQTDINLNLSLSDNWPHPLNLDALRNWTTWQQSNLRPHFAIDELILDAPIIATWQLGEPAQGHWLGIEQGLQLSPLCLMQDATASFCLESNHHRLQWQGQNLPWQAWLAAYKPDNITLLGEFVIQGHLDWRPPMTATNPSANFDWTLHNSLNWPYFFINVQTPEVALPLTLLNWRNELRATPNKLNLTTQAQINQEGQLDTQITLSKTASESWTDAKLDGQLTLDIVDLYLAEDWQNLLAIKQQHLHLNAKLAGQPQAPEVVGNLNLALDFDLPLLGLTEQQIEISSDLNYPILPSDPLVLNGRWQQPADNQLDLNITYDPSLLNAGVAGADQSAVQDANTLTTMAPIFIRIDSDNFQLLNTALGDINSQIGIRVNYHPNAIQVLGGVTLQNTQLNLALETGQSRTAVSGDEVLLDAQGQPVAVEETSLPLFLDFTVGFGEAVQINGLDARIWLGGELNLVQTPQQTEPQAFGQVRIERGHLNIDRRNRIEIDQSRFNFNGPIDNPRLDVNLFRVVDQTTARLNITGQATRPQFVFYSTPTQSQARIVNLLIFGRAGDLQNEPNYESQMLTALYKLGLQNNLPILNDVTQTLGIEDIYFDVQDREVSNLILGRAINEQIYINYAHNLSGVGQSAVQLFFNLTPNWSIKSESGETSNAIDLIYRLER